MDEARNPQSNPDPEWVVAGAPDVERVEDKDRRAIVLAFASIGLAAVAAGGLWVLSKRFGAKRRRRPGSRVHDLSTRALGTAHDAGRTIARSVAHAPAAVKERIAS